MSMFWKLVIFSSAIFFFSWFFAYKTGINSLIVQSEDTLPAMFLPLSIIKEETFYLDTYYNTMLRKYPHPDDKTFEKQLTPFYLRRIVAGNGLVHYVSAFPIMAGILALPVYVLPVLFGVSATFANLTVLAHTSSALIVAFAGSFLYLVLKKRFSLDEKQSLLLMAVYMFGTVNYAMVSQALWQHGAVQLFSILGLYFLLGSFAKSIFKHKVLFLFLASLMLGFAVISRPTAIITVVLMSFLVVERFGLKAKGFIALLIYIFGLIPAALFFLWYNSAFYVTISNQGYTSQLLVNWLGAFPEGFFGLWFSPSKGAFVYSPILLFSLVGLYLSIAKGAWRRNFKYIVFGNIVILHALFMGSWKHWFGGWSFGYRMLSDVLPFLILLMIPYIKSDIFAKTKAWFFGLFVISLLVQLFGILFFDGIWHAAYDKGYRDTSWLWSVRDSEFMFTVRRALVKFGVLEKACETCLPGKV